MKDTGSKEDIQHYKKLNSKQKSGQKCKKKEKKLKFFVEENRQAFCS
jgi:hypothetical protein